MALQPLSDRERIARLEDVVFANDRTGEPGITARLRRVEFRLITVNAILAALSFLAGAWAQSSHLLK